MVQADHPLLSIRAQCQLLNLAPASYYYQPKEESELNLKLMRLIDKQHSLTPFYGVPKMTAHLKREGYQINHKRIRRLMKLMDIRTVYPRPKTSKPGKGHKIYPYLLRDLEIIRPNQVWGTDITYIPMARGFLYLVAIIDWYTRYVIAWQISNSLERYFCIQTLNEALQIAKPEIFNTDQGVPFTSEDFTSILLNNDIKVSMDGKGRAIDNVFTERLWWSVKYEEVYLNEYQDGVQLFQALKRYFYFYNFLRPHASLNDKTPAECYPLSKNKK